MPGERLYCPMCGEAFEVGEERCARCDAWLPAVAPDLEAMERAAHTRSEGPALAWSCLRRGFRLLRLRPALLVLPLLFAIGGQVRDYSFFTSHAPPMLAPAPRPVSAGLAMEVWLAQELDGRVLAQSAVSAADRMCAPVPLMPLARLASVTERSPVGVQYASAWADALLAAAANALLWCMLWRAVAVARAGRFEGAAESVARTPWLDVRLLAVVLALSLLSIAGMVAVTNVGWRAHAREMMLLFNLAWVALATLGCAVVVAGSTNEPPGALWTRAVLNQAGAVYVALSVLALAVPLHLASFAVNVWAPFGGRSLVAARSVVLLVSACITACLATGTALGFFCLLDRRAVGEGAEEAVHVCDAELAAP